MMPKKVTQKLVQKVTNYEQKLAQMIDQLADQIVVGARRRVIRNLKTPKSNSPLAQSIRVEKDAPDGLRVITDQPYARFVEFGTQTQPARPFLTPAVEEVKVTFSGLAQNIK